MDQAHILSILFFKMYYLFAGQTFLFELFCLFFEDVSLRDPCIRIITEDAGFDSILYEKNWDSIFSLLLLLLPFIYSQSKPNIFTIFSELEIHV